MSDIRAISPGRWQVTHERCRIGAMSFVNVTCRASAAGRCAATTAGHVAAIAAAAMTAGATTRADLNHRLPETALLIKLPSQFTRAWEKQSLECCLILGSCGHFVNVYRAGVHRETFCRSVA